MKTISLRIYLILLLIIFYVPATHAQDYIFAQLKGTPVNTDGWSFTGSAIVGNITGSDNSEIVLCPNALSSAGSIFYNKPINLSVCSNWSAEFDFRIYDGTRADGIAFCFLEVPPSGFVQGAGLGIPGTANGLKICFDQFPNCPPYVYDGYPKIEIRYGVGYDECAPQPTAGNVAGNLDFLYAPTYKHAKVYYKNGNISVYVDNILFLTGFQEFTFTGYLGFCAGTGANADNHSIKNVVIYADMPPSIASLAGANQIICSGETLPLGTANNPEYVYSWSPAEGLSAADISNPSAIIMNTTEEPAVKKYYVSTSFKTSPGCASGDSVTVVVNAVPSISVQASANSICDGTAVTFTATAIHGGVTPVYQWKKNGVNVGNNSPVYKTDALQNDNIISCILISDIFCSGTNAFNSNTIKMIFTKQVTPSVQINASANNVCAGTAIRFTAVSANGGDQPVYQWQVNGKNKGANQPLFTSNSISDGDIVSCILTGNSACATIINAISNPIAMQVKAILVPSVTISASADNTCPGAPVTFTANPVNGGSAPDYQWKVNGMGLGANSANFTSLVLNDGDLVVCEMKSNAACAAPGTVISDSIKVKVQKPVIASVSIRAADTTVCVGDEVSFTATAVNGGSAPVYEWILDGASIGTNSAYFNSSTLTDGAVVSCRLSSNAGCVAKSLVQSAPIAMSVLEPPSINILASKSPVCVGDAITFSSTVAGAGIDPHWEWRINQGITGETRSSFTGNNFLNDDQVSCILVPGTGSCSNTAVSSNIERIIINALPNIRILPEDTTVLPGSIIQLNVLSAEPLNSYQWQPAAVLNNGGILSPVTLPLDITTGFIFNASTVDGCPVSKSAIVKVYQNLFIPKAFTPNQNGVNDLFRIPANVALKLDDFSIYDRWGRKIFSTKDINRGWDGSYGGIHQPGGVYIYIISGRDTKGPVFLKGSFVLMR